MNAAAQPGRPIAVAARLRMTDAAVERLRSAVTRDQKREALQVAHDELAATLVPRLEALQRSGAIVDFATSWVLEEMVAHAAPGRRDAVADALRTFPELRDVSIEGLTGHRRR